ncbi:MAG TPA: hypothetical protein VFS20_31735 [Longimicrobium sp.]|nr:hypothetical protein [Longimicrobium sp.]
MLTLLQPAEGARQAWSYFDHDHNAYWRILPDNTIEYVAGNSLHGHRIRGVFRGDSIVGRLSGWTDIVGAPSRAYRVVARREPCSADGSPEPPPSASALRDSLAPAIAAAVMAPLLPAVRRGVPLGLRPTRFRFGFAFRAAGILAAHPEVRPPPTPNDTSAIWVRVDDDVSASRDSAGAVVSVCGLGEGATRHHERARYRFVRTGSTWRFAGTQLLERGEGACTGAPAAASAQP